jgi:hypothetical protein
MLRSSLLAMGLLLGFSLQLWGQWPGVRLVAEIPFSFYVGDQAFLAGSYTVDRDLNGQLLRLRRDGDPQLVAISTIRLSAYPLGKGKSPQLVFLRYDNDHAFLRQAWDNGTGSGWDVAKCRTEIEHVTSRLVTSKSPEIVTIAARQFAR